MQRILIVEDEELQRRELSEGLKQEYPAWDIRTAATLEEALSLLRDSLETGSLFTLFLLDIRLDTNTASAPSFPVAQENTDGFQFAEEIRRYPDYYTSPILFLTSVSEKISFALSQYHCYNYIEKPYHINEIIEQIEHMLLTDILRERTVQIRDKEHIIHTVYMDDIYYVEASSHSLILKMKKGSLTTCDYNMDTILQHLGKNFCRCHKKYLVNLKHMKNYDKTARFLTIGDYRISVGRTFKESLEKRLFSLP